MKNKLMLGALLFAFVSNSYAQKNECKFVKFKDGNKTWELIQVPGKLGMLSLGKSEGKYIGLYQPRGIVNAFRETKNMIALRIDSVQFNFEGHKPVILKVGGSGRIQNANDKLRYTFDTVNFSFAIEGDEALEAFKSGKLISFSVFAEKEAQWADLFSEERQAQLRQAFICIP